LLLFVSAFSLMPSVMVPFSIALLTALISIFSRYTSVLCWLPARTILNQEAFNEGVEAGCRHWRRWIYWKSPC